MEPTPTGNAQACCIKSDPRDGEVNTNKGASTAGPAHTLAKLGLLGSFAQQLQQGVRLVARSNQDFQGELRLASILAISEEDARTARAAPHPLEEEGECKKPAEPRSVSRCSSDVGQVTPICRDQGQRRLDKAASSSSIDAFEWQDIELTEATVCKGNGSDSQTSDWQGVKITVSTECTASLVERGGGDKGHFRARGQPAAAMTAMQAAAAAAAADAAAKKQKGRQAAANRAVISVPIDNLRPSGWFSDGKPLSWMWRASEAKAQSQSAVHEKFYGHLLPHEGVEEMLSVFTEDADT